MHFGPEENPSLGFFGPIACFAFIQRYWRRFERFCVRPWVIKPGCLFVSDARKYRRLAIHERHCCVRSPVTDRRWCAIQEDFLQGVLIETPSAVWCVDRFLEEADFLSVGTNDLVQYLFAVERGLSMSRISTRLTTRSCCRLFSTWLPTPQAQEAVVYLW